MLASKKHSNLKPEEERVLSLIVYKLSHWECSSPVLPWKLLQYPTEQKGKMPLTCLLLCSCLYRELRDTYFFETSVLFGWSSGAESPSQHCWCLLFPVGHEDKDPRRNYLKLKKIPPLFSALCKDIITSVPILYPAKSSPACTSKKEEVVCFAANSTFMPKLQGVM